MSEGSRPVPGMNVPGAGRSGAAEEPESERIVIRDRRRIDPDTFTVRQPGGDSVASETTETTQSATEGEDPVVVDGTEEAAEVLDPAPESDAGAAPDAPADPAAEELAAANARAEELTNDLKRLQAEYVNYKRRVDRDRDVAREAGIEKVLMDLFSVFDDLRAARQHEELSGGFKLVAEEIEKVAARYGLESYGAKDDPFDPQIHEALMQVPTPGIEEPVCLDVMQVGFRRGDKVLRAARVAVAMPSDEPAGSAAEADEA